MSNGIKISLQEYFFVKLQELAARNFREAKDFSGMVKIWRNMQEKTFVDTDKEVTNQIKLRAATLRTDGYELINQVVKSQSSRQRMMLFAGYEDGRRAYRLYVASKLEQ